MSDKSRNIFFIIGLIAIVVMCLTFEVSFADLWDYITRAGYWLGAIFILWGFLYMLNALTWQVILKGSGPCNVSYWHLLRLTITGFALNYATPVGLLGGEPYKILEMTPHVGTRRATSSVLLFAMMHIFAHFSFWATSIVIYIIMAIFGMLPMDALMAVLLLLMSLFCAAGIYMFIKGYKNGMVLKVLTLISRIPGLKKWATRFISDNEESLRKIDSQISELHSQNRRSFWASYMLEYVGRALQSLEIFFIILILSPDLPLSGYPMSMLHAFLILAFTSLFANLLFFLPLQLGGREGGFAMSTAQMGMTNEMGLFISIICRLRELFWTAIGLALMKLGGRSTSSPQDPPASSQKCQ